MNIKEFFEQRKARRLFPRWKKDFWYCGEFYEYQYELMKQGKPWHGKDIELPCETFLVNPFENYNQIREGAILPCVKNAGWIGFYLIIKKWRYSSAGSDFASWDDGYYMDLELHHCERAQELPKEVKVSDCGKWNGAHKLMWYCVGVTPGDYCTAGKEQFGSCPFRFYKRTYNKMQKAIA